MLSLLCFACYRMQSNGATGAKAGETGERGKPNPYLFHSPFRTPMLPNPPSSTVREPGTSLLSTVDSDRVSPQLVIALIFRPVVITLNL